MKRWYQRQWWYIEKPMPWAMIPLWPFLWVVGTVDELRRRLSKPAPISYSMQPGLTIDFNGVTLPWNATAREIHNAYEYPTMEWELPDDPALVTSTWRDLVDEWDTWAEANGYVETGTYYGQTVWTRPYPIVDRDYE